MTLRPSTALRVPPGLGPCPLASRSWRAAGRAPLPDPVDAELVAALVAGAGDPEIEGVEVVVRPALEATADDVLAADGYLLATPANFGYMSGALKHFFDSTFLAVGGSLSDDGSAGDSREVRRDGRSGCSCTAATTPPGRSGRCMSIVGALGWRQSAEVLEVMGDVEDTDRDAAYELGATLAALLSA